MQISIAKESDIPELCELLNILFSQEAEFSPDYTAQARGLSLIIRNPQVGQIFIARMNSQTMGMVSLLYTVSTALGERVCLLEDMVVLPDGRGTGIGSRLVDTAIKFARDAGCKRITLLTDRSNVNAQRFYKNHGFKSSDMLPFRLSL